MKRSHIINQWLKKAGLLFTVLLLLVVSQKAHATHAAGADFTYKCLGGLQYELTITFYRDCGGIAEPANISVNYKSVTGGYNLNATANKIAVTGEEITQPCITAVTSCNGGGIIGLRKFVYSAIITLPAAEPDWVFSYSVCCRNCAITTINSPCASSTNLYVEATLNNFIASCNNSPVFSNIPIAFTCIGQNFNYNHGVLDPDGDSLAYSLITPRISSSGTVSYIAPHNTNNPIITSSGFNVNSVTGDLNFTPTQSEIGILTVLVREYRNGQLIGSVIRDMQVYTQNCPNNLPTATGINGTNNFSINACPNQQICFTVNTADLDASQTVNISTNNGITGATYTIGTGARPTLTFCWTPTNGDIGPLPNTFTLTITDDACPTKGVQTYSYTIYIPGPYYTVSSTNVLCYGTATGTADADPVTGNNYSYIWSNGATTQNISGLIAGTYTVTATDSVGCSASQTVTITQPVSITTSAAATNASCLGVCNGSVNVTLTGGTAPVTYLWSNGRTTQDVNALCTGNYTITISEGNGCTRTISNNVAFNYTVTASASSTNVSCFGNNTGTVTLTPASGTAPYTYAWSNGATIQNLGSVVAGTYTATVTDANGCKATSNATITQPASALTSSLAKTNVSCFGNSTGSATLTVNGGTPSYTYNWSNGATTQNISSVPSGNYTVTVTDSKGCTSTSSVSITQPSVLSVSLASQTNVKCFGNNTGALNLNVSGGTTAYSYNWNNGATIQNISGLASGAYTCTITDANNCTASTSANITQPAATLSASVSSQTNVKCFGNNTGAINLSVSGGTTGYSYAWSNGANNQNISGLTAGTYSVTVTDANNCTTSASATVTQPSAVLNASVSSQTNVKCFGNNTGSSTVTPAGGTSPYTYSWSNATTTASNSNLTSGTYTCSITDANNCTTSITANITQPLATLSASVSSQTNVKCFGNNTGSAIVTPAGGTSPYTYSWSNGASTAINNNLTAGTYTCTVTDANNCTTSLSATIPQPIATLSASVSSQTNVKCFGNNTGAINLNVSGGTFAYSYVWSNSANTQNISGLVSGSYTVTVTDANNCTATASATITQPTEVLNASVLSQTNVKCFGNNTGAINLTVNGGTTAYTYAWSNGTTTQNISSLASGSYSVTITDANNCTATASATISQPVATLSLSTTKTNVRCFGNNTGVINLSVSGGTTAYTYLWSNTAITQNLTTLIAGNYTVTVTDANNCTSSITTTITQPAAALNISSTKTDVKCFSNATGAINLTVTGGTTAYSYSWSNGTGTQNISGLTSGNYTVTVTDANNCTATSTINITQPAAVLNATTIKTDVKCFGNATGNITLTAGGGTTPYTYSWSNGATTQNINSLTSGTYTVTVRDVNLCSTTTTVTINQPGAALTSSLTGTNVNCRNGNDGFALLNVNGGTSPYSYNWSNASTTQNITGLIAGNYTVTITDINACTSSANVSITQPAASLTLSNTNTNINCIGNPSGSIDLTVAGGTTPYSYQWSNGSVQQDLTNLSAGPYSVTVTDNNGCSATSAATITQPAGALSVANNVTNVKCYGDATGNIDLTASAGTPPYSFMWSNGITNDDLQNLVAGAYTVTISDANGCTLINTLFVTEPTAPLLLTLNTAIDVLCYGDSTGIIDLQTTGGTPTYSYSWSNGNNSEDLLNIPSGNYSVVVTDVNNCTTSSAANIQQPVAPLSMEASTSNLPCHDLVNGTIDVTTLGGTIPYSYQWNTGNIEEDLNNLNTGTYTVTITDAQGCVLSNDYTLIYSAAILNSTATLQEIKCHGDSTGNIDLEINGGTAPFIYAWNQGSQSEDLNNIFAGTYDVLITDVNGCTTSNSFTLSEPVASLQGTNTSANQLCYGDSTGWIDLTLTGGTYPYNITWNTGNNTEDINNLPASTYNVNVIDANGCPWNNTITITGPAAALNASFTANNLFCNSDNTGSIQSTINGGTTPYSVTWNNSINQVDLNNLSAGDYTVMIIDSNNCPFTQTISITEPATLNSSIAQQINIDCFSNSIGSVQLNTTGGTTPYSFQWSNGDTTANVQNLIAGNYSYTITDAHNCSTNGSTIITQPANYLDVTNSVSAINCHGDSTGAIDLNVSGGTPGYSFTWSNGATTQDIQSLSTGSYTVTVTDNNGCIYTNTYAVNEPAASLAVNASSTTNVDCYGMQSGAIGLLTNGGTAPYNYSWSNGLQTDSINTLNGGTYSVLITDNNGCTTSGSWTLLEPSATITTTVTTTAVQCFGNATGTIDVTIYGGTAPYSYSWSNGNSSEDLQNITAGTYTLTIIDAHQCTISLTATINQPNAALANTLIVTDVFCFGNNTGAIQTQLTGGTAPYIFQWSNGQSTTSLNNLNAGIYAVTITDANGCVQNDSTSVVQPLTPLTASVTAHNINCYGDNSGSVDLSVNGGTGGYTYLWNNGSTTQSPSNMPAGNYSVVITDIHNCTTTANATITTPSYSLNIRAISNDITCNSANNGSINLNISGGTPGYTILWNNGDTATILNNLSSGTYSATITDANGCSKTVTSNIAEPANALQVSINATNANCLLTQTGSITLNVNGGTAPYVYNWSTGATTQNLSSQSAGTYSVIITDANGCTQQRKASISDGSAVTINANGGATICVGNTVTLTATSLPNVQFQWYFNGSAINGAVNNTFITPAAGTYTLVATASCGSYTSNPIEVVVRMLENVSVSNNFIICPGESVQLLAGGGNDYIWTPTQGLSNANVPNPIASPTTTTTYTVTVKDGYGCSATASVQVAVVCDTLDVPNGFSPNDDGTNDHFVIDGITHYPGNILFIYNRWGNLVYKKTDYDNSWDGTSNVSGIYMAKALPNGTYFFILDLNNNTKPINNYVVLRR